MESICATSCLVASRSVDGSQAIVGFEKGDWGRFHPEAGNDPEKGLEKGVIPGKPARLRERRVGGIPEIPQLGSAKGGGGGGTAANPAGTELVPGGKWSGAGSAGSGEMEVLAMEKGRPSGEGAGQSGIAPRRGAGWRRVSGLAFAALTGRGAGGAKAKGLPARVVT